MPHLRAKIKEENMSLRENLDDLEIAIHDISQGINALQVMTLGLMEAQDPYADGFNALNLYLTEADRAAQKHLTACLDEI